MFSLILLNNTTWPNSKVQWKKTLKFCEKKRKKYILTWGRTGHFKVVFGVVLKKAWELLVYRNRGEITGEDTIILPIHSCLHRKNFFIGKDDRWMVMELTRSRIAFAFLRLFSLAAKVKVLVNQVSNSLFAYFGFSSHFSHASSRIALDLAFHLLYQFRCAGISGTSTFREVKCPTCYLESL